MRTELTLDPARWERLRGAFAEASATDDSERRQYIEKVAADDPELAQLLESLLAVHGGLDGRTQSDRRQWMADATRTFASIGSGERVGGFVLREPIGQGGMGLVFRAERVDGHVTQEVAIKFVHPSFLDEASLRRFRVERDAIATLRHPNIARLFDAGTTDDGIPYAVMELIDGVPLTRWCDDGKLGLESRLTLFATLCDAVRHAHEHLILHRDIKPANVLVTAEGMVKLIDFGIATPLTAQGERAEEAGGGAMTVAYAAPEQVRGAALDVRCDVYQLGVLLHELLCGVPSDPPSREAQHPGAAPTWPSLSAARQSQEVAERRGLPSAARLAARLRGDIDAVVARCLADVVDRRYPSAAAVAEEVRRVLARLPVSARSAEPGYRAMRFLQRHAIGLGAAGLVAGLVAAAGYREWAASEALARQADVLRAQKAVADRAVDFVAGIFRSADPSAGLSPQAPVREVLERASERVEREFAAEPAVRGRLQRVLAESWLSVEENERALDAARRAVDALASETIEIDERIAANLVASRAYGVLGMRAEAITAAATAMGLHLGRGDDDAVSWRAKRELLGAIASSSGRQAVVGQMSLLVEHLASRSEASEAFATVAMQLARYLDQRQAPWGDGARAEALARAAWDGYFDGLPSRDLRRVEARMRLGAILENSGYHDAGIDLLKQSLADYRLVLGERSESAGALLIHLGNAYEGWGKRMEAIEHFRQARAMFEALGEGQPTEGAAVASYSMAGLLGAEDGSRSQDAIEAYHRAIRDAMGSFGPWHRNTAVFRIGYGSYLTGIGEWAEVARQLQIADRSVDFRSTNPSVFLDLIEATAKAGHRDLATQQLAEAEALDLDDEQRGRLAKLQADFR